MAHRSWALLLVIAAGTALVLFAVWPDPILWRTATPTAVQDRPKPDILRVQEDDTLRSVWVDAERSRYANLLKDHPCDTLVLPVQTQHFGFDRATRSLMTAQLAQALAADKTRCVADPYLVSNALGEGARRIDMSLVQSLAASIGAKTIVSTYVGHDDHMKMEVFMQVQAQRTSAAGAYQMLPNHSWLDIPFTDEHPPFDAWAGLLPEVVDAISPGLRVPTAGASPDAPLALELPERPEQLAGSVPAGSLDAAQRYELLGSIGPKPDVRITESLFEKAWLAASAAPATKESRRIRARALMNLNYRPAAIAALAQDDDAEARFLHALLDGNLPEAEEAFKAIHVSSQRLIGALELRDLRVAYARSPKRLPEDPDITNARSRSPLWDALLEARSTEGDNWSVNDNLPLKVALEASYPVEGFTLEQIARGAGAIGSIPGEHAAQLLATRHVNRVLAEQPKRFCCTSFQLRPGDLEIVQLISARAQANLEKGLVRAFWVHGLPDRAFAMLDAYDAQFSGNPHFLALRASYLVEMQTHKTDERAEEHQQVARKAARSSAYWEHGPSNYTWTAMVSVGIPSQRSAEFMGAYQREFPPRLHFVKGDRFLPYATTLEEASSPSDYMVPAAAGVLLAEMRSRFHGSPVAEDYLAKTDAKPGASNDIATLRKKIDVHPEDWDGYFEVADALIRDGAYAEAASVAQQYPGFKAGSGENTVGLSNQAARIGSMLWWHGDIASATALYRLAATYQNGSDSTMLATQRLQYAAADFSGAAGSARERIDRYQGGYAFRDYIELLFAFGHSREAWAVFMQTAGRFDIPEFWMAAQVGHRVGGASAKAVGDWLESAEVRSIRVKDDIPALRFGLMYFLMDRAPFDELPSVLARVEGAASAKVESSNGLLMKQAPSQQGSRLIMRSLFRGSERKGKVGDMVASPFVLFASAYVALRKGDYAQAVKRFDAMAAYYEIEGDHNNPGIDAALPYFAFAAAKSGDTLGLKAFLEAGSPEQRSFESHLAQAYFSGLDHRVDEALSHLHAALGLKPLNDGLNNITDYQYAETCIWLFDETHEAKYRDLALAWAKSYQTMEPATAWAYALEARYGDPHGKGHLRAVAMALYLDHDSLWLQGVPPAELEPARKWLSKNNLFVDRKQEAAKDI